MENKCTERIVTDCAYKYFSLIKHYAIEKYGGSECIDPLILDLGMSVLLGSEHSASLPEKGTQYPLNRRLYGPQSRYGRREGGTNFTTTGARTQISRPPSPQPVAISTALSRLTSKICNLLSIAILPKRNCRIFRSLTQLISNRTSCIIFLITKKELVAFSPEVNYTDRGTAECRQS
jgi:hypothetical protein